MDHRDSPLAFGHGHRCPCCAGRASFTGAGVEQTVVLPQLHLDVKFVRGLRHHGAEAFSYGPHGDSPVAVHMVVDVPFVLVVRVPQVQSMEDTVVLP